MKLSRKDCGMHDYVLELSEQEADALKKAVKDADGRKSEVKLARELLGL